jgi:hypothetical protein
MRTVLMSYVVQEGGDEMGSDGGLTESPFQRLEVGSRLASAARSRSRRLGMGTSYGGNGGGPSNTSPPHLPPGARSISESCSASESCRKELKWRIRNKRLLVTPLGTRKRGVRRGREGWGQIEAGYIL